MKAPDHHPYLTEGDLRTAEDVLEWLARPRCCKTLGGHIARLRARLDRERRQACRRGALERWQRLSRLVRWARAGRSGWHWDEVGDALWWTLRQYLAFRAAAGGVDLERRR